MSLQQIANRLRLDFPGDYSMCISHEAIYQVLYIPSRGALKLPWQSGSTASLKNQYLLQRPRDLAQAVDEAIALYNAERPHTSLKMQTPDALHRASIG